MFQSPPDHLAGRQAILELSLRLGFVKLSTKPPNFVGTDGTNDVVR
jgi:hypothetical protein